MKTDFATDILKYCRSRQEAMIRVLADLAKIETPSREPEAQEAIFGILDQHLKRLKYFTLRVPGNRTGGYLFARPRDRKHDVAIQLLIGHCDTVWPTGTLDTMHLIKSADILKGPGVFDMKAGLTEILFALRALLDLDLRPEVLPVVLINSDEEIGSRETTIAIRRLARIADRAYVMEPPLGLDGRLKTARKGLGRFTLTVHGRPAHAGLNPGQGASAILELSYQIQQLFKMNDTKRGISVNVGMIEGGVSPNVVAPLSSAVVDVRAMTQTDADEVTRRIHALKPLNSDTTLTIEGAFGRPPMAPTTRNQALWAAAKHAGNRIGLQLQQATAGGGSDGNTTSLYCPTLDGLGAVGDGAHAEHEFIYVNRLSERTALLVLLLMLPPMNVEHLQKSHQHATV